MILRRFEYLKDPQNYLQLTTYICVIIFVFPLGHICWCYPSWKWQVGALAIFLAWIDYFILLKHIPYIGQSIAMLYNVYLNFLKVVHLPILLIVAFALPLYMIFVATSEVCSLCTPNSILCLLSIYGLSRHVASYNFDCNSLLYNNYTW